MRWLINYLRSVFCKHEWKHEEIFAKINDEFGKTEGPRVSATCEKCGWHKSYWKY